MVNRLFLGCLFSRIIGNNFPLSIYLNQEVEYHTDISIGDEVIGEVEVAKDLGRNRYEISTICRTLSGEMVMSGKAMIMQE